jgi:thiamine biosynthesis lipoprotein
MSAAITQPDPDSPASGAGKRALVQRSRRMMGTEVSVQIAAEPEQARAAELAADSVLDWLAEVDARLSRFRPDSELSQLNRSSDTWFGASELTFAAVQRAIAAAQATGGLFDPTLLPQLEALGYDRDFSELVNPGRVDTLPDPTTAPDAVSVAAHGAWHSVALDSARRRIQLPAGVTLDLGGIAKGWAADVALERFCTPFPGALVNVGGDLRLQGGPQPGEAWSIGIRDPQVDRPELALGGASQETYRGMLGFSRGGLATSGAVRRWWWRGGERVHHLLDPRTGRPMRLWLGTPDAPTDTAVAATSDTQIATVTALAPTAARAEVATKVALLRGFPDALRAVERAWEHWGAVAVDEAEQSNPDLGVALVIALGAGQLVWSSNLNDWLASWGTAGAPLPAVVGGAPGDSE